MTTLVERTIRTQRENLKKAHNSRFIANGNEYRITYSGGLAEFFAIYGRRVGERNFKYIDGFSAYKFYTKEQVVSYAKALVAESVKN